MTLLSSAPRQSEQAGDGGIATEPTSKRHRPFSFSVGWTIVAAMAALIVRATVHAGLDTDAFWQVAAGNWMLEHHSIIRADVFSYGVNGRPWFAEEWSFEVALAFLVRHLGPFSYWLVSGAPCVGALVMSALRWRRLNVDDLWMGILAVCVGVGLLIGLEPRPQDLSYLFFAVELYLLTVARRHRYVLAALPFLLLVWANVHGSFLLGLGVLGLETALSAVGRTRWQLSADRAAATRHGMSQVSNSTPLPLRNVTLTLFFSATAALVNPHGWHLYPYVVKVTSSGPLAALIEEWQSPNFHDIGPVLGVSLPLMIAVVGLAVRKVRVELFDLVLWIVLLAATLHAIRFAPYLVIAFGGLAAPWWTAGHGSSHRVTRTTIPAAALACGLLLSGGFAQPGLPVKSGPFAVPVAATSWLHGKAGRVFSTYAWNDYLIERGVPVFVDGRTDLYFGTNILGTYTAVSSLTVNPDRVFTRWHVRYVMWPANKALTTYLASDPKWKLVYRQGPAVVFELAEPIHVLARS